MIVVAVVGSRQFSDKPCVENIIAILAERWGGDLKVISGGAGGVDSWARDYCIGNGIWFEEFPADWNSYGKRAGFLRNQQMIEMSQGVVAFWDGKSKGTKLTIDLALQHRKPLEVHFA